MDRGRDLELAVVESELLQALQPALHLAHPGPQLADLVSGPDVDLLIEVTALDRPSGLDQLLEIADQPSRQEDGEEEREAERTDQYRYQDDDRSIHIGAHIGLALDDDLALGIAELASQTLDLGDQSRAVLPDDAERLAPLTLVDERNDAIVDERLERMPRRNQIGQDRSLFGRGEQRFGPLLPETSGVDLALILREQHGWVPDQSSPHGCRLGGVSAHYLVDRDQARDGIVEDLLLHGTRRGEERQRDPTEDRHQCQEKAEAADDLEPERDSHPPSILEPMYKPLGWAAAAGAGLAAYALLEPYRYRLVTHELRVRWAGPPLDVLHLADTHLSPRDTRLISFLKELPEQLPKVPDLVVATGDMIEGDAAIEPLLESISGIEARYGRYYVFGSHDYYVSSGPSYTKYFSRNKVMRRAIPTDRDRLEEGLQAKGWIALTNTEQTIEIGAARVRMAGVDDPYLNRHETTHIHREGGDDLAIALVHAPDVVSEWILNGFDLVLAGHTHAGQVRVPLLGALVTNCSLPSALASGANRIGDGWLHVSPGLGTGRYSPIRFLAQPEATLLRLLPAR